MYFSWHFIAIFIYNWKSVISILAQFGNMKPYQSNTLKISMKDKN